MRVRNRERIDDRSRKKARSISPSRRTRSLDCWKCSTPVWTKPTDALPQHQAPTALEGQRRRPCKCYCKPPLHLSVDPGGAFSCSTAPVPPRLLLLLGRDGPVRRRAELPASCLAVSSVGDKKGGVLRAHIFPKKRGGGDIRSEYDALDGANRPNLIGVGRPRKMFRLPRTHSPHTSSNHRAARQAHRRALA